MAIYRNISLSFWTDQKVEDDFTPEDKYMYLYLLTNPHTNIIGCYEISVKQISRQTGYNEEAVSRILHRLQNMHDVIRYCDESKELLIIRWSKYNWTRSEKLEKPISKAIESIKCDQFKKYLGTLQDNRSDALSIPYPYGMDTTVTVSVTDTVSDTGTATIKVTPKKPKVDDQAFNAFWAEYPKKKAKSTAYKAWAKVDPKLYDTIMTALAAQKAGEDWTKENGKFIPHATTWLNQERWEDELPQENHGLPAGYRPPISD